MASADPWGAGGAADSFIDTDHAGGELAGSLAGDGLVTKDYCSEPVLGIVGEGDGLVGITDGLDAEDRTEGFDGHDVHVMGAVVEDGGGDEVAFHRLIAHSDRCALADSITDLGDDMVFLFTHDHGADLGVLVVAVADGEGAGFFGELGHELVFDGVLDIDAFGGDADLAAVAEGVVDAEGGGFVEVGAFEDDHGIFGTEFEDESFETIGGGGHDVLAGVL